MTALVTRLTLWTALATLVVGVAPPRVEAGAPRRDATARAEDLGAKARDAYRAEDFNRAIELYLEAHETAASPGFLFNIAFIYDRKLDELELARDYYARVAAFRAADPELVARARERLAELETEAPRRPGPPEPGVPTPERPTPTQPGPVTPEPRPGPGPVVEPDRTLPLALLVGGGATLAAGVVTGVVAASTERDFHAEADLSRRRGLQSAGRTQALVADILMVTGAVAAGVGLVLWLVDDAPSGRSSANVAPTSLHLTPAVFPGGAGLIFGGRH